MSSLSEQTIQANPLVRRRVQTWKVFPILKASLTWLPLFSAWRKHRASTGGTDTPRYCYSVWLRRLTMLHPYGFGIADAHVGELGPGDSIGIGLAALLFGAAQYVGLYIVPFSAKAPLKQIFDELVRLYSRRDSIPNSDEFPRHRPTLDSYEFPVHLIDVADFSTGADMIRNELRTGLNRSGGYASHVIDFSAHHVSPFWNGHWAIQIGSGN